MEPQGRSRMGPPANLFAATIHEANDPSAPRRRVFFCWPHPALAAGFRKDRRTRTSSRAGPSPSTPSWSSGARQPRASSVRWRLARYGLGWPGRPYNPGRETGTVPFLFFFSCVFFIEKVGIVPTSKVSCSCRLHFIPNIPLLSPDDCSV